jgi:predicted GNAT family acetyltransferase
MYEAETPRFGVFLDGRLVAAANLALWRPAVVSPGLLTHPEYRRRGFATAALGAVSEYGLSLGYLMLYQTLMENTGAVRAAEAVGYRRFATHQAVRLKPAV